MCKTSVNGFLEKFMEVLFMERRNKNVKSRGNGEGTIYYSETLQRWVAQYTEPSREKKNIKTKEK